MPLEATVTVDLPSLEVPRQRGRLDKVRALVGMGPTPLEDRLILTPLAVVEGLATGLKDAGVHDAVRLVIDGGVIMIDPKDEPYDLPFIVTSLLGGAWWDRPFEELHLEATALRGAAAFTLDVRVKGRVDSGERELTARVTLLDEDASVMTLRTFARGVGEALSRAFGGARFGVSQRP